MAATVPVQHRTLSEEGYDAASYLWVWRQLTCHMHYICIHGDLYIEALDIFIEMWISGSISLWLRFVYLFHMKLDVLNVIHLRLNCCLMNL